MLSTEWQDPRTRAWNHALTSKMNAIYYQRRIARWKLCDIVIKVLAAIAASATINSFLRDNPVVSGHGPNAAAILGVVSASLMIFSIVLQIPDRVRAFGVLLSEYTSHAQVFERLYLAAHKEDEATFEPRLDEAMLKYDETGQRESKDDPTPSKRLLAKSYSEVEKSIRAAASVSRAPG